MPRALALALIVLATAAVNGQSARDLAGTWKMDSSRSHLFSQHGNPHEIAIRFETDGQMLTEVLTVVSSQGESSTQTLKYALDGVAIANRSSDEVIKTRAFAKDNELVLEWIDNGGTVSRSLNLSNDRKTLTMRVHDSNPEGDADSIITLVKQ